MGKTGPNFITAIMGIWDLNPDSLIPTAPPYEGGKGGSERGRDFPRLGDWTPLLSQARGLRLSL